MAWQPDYVTTAELRTFATRSSSTADDTQLALAITAASRVVDEYCNRQFGQVTPVAARQYTAEWHKRWRRWIVDTDDISSVTGLLVNVDDDDDDVHDQAVDVYRLWPFNAPGNGQPWTRIIVDPDSAVSPTCAQGGVEVTALWGWTSVPTPVKTATLIEAHRIVQRRNSPYGIAGSPETGSELRLLRAVDVDVQKILAPYRRQWGAA